MKIDGTLVNMFMYDVNGELNLQKACDVISKIHNSKRTEPLDYIRIDPKPLYFELEDKDVVFMNQNSKLKTKLRLYSVGAISVIFELQVNTNIRKIYKLKYEPKVIINKKERTLKDISREIFNILINKDTDIVINNYPIVLESIPEEQQILFVNGHKIKNFSTFVERNDKEIAGYLRYEPQYKLLSTEAVESSMKNKFRYTNRELAIIDWDAEFIITDKGKDEDYLTVVELANVILLELRTYDRMLDDIIENTRVWLGVLDQKAKASHKNLELAIKNMARIQLGFRVAIDNLENPTKFFEDLPIARFYKIVAERLFLEDWEKSVQEKLSEMSNIYQFYHTAADMSRANVLEWCVIILFIIDLILIGLGTLRP